MELILYNSNSEKNRLDKTNFLKAILTLNGTLRNECSILNPSIQLELKQNIKIKNDNLQYVKDDRSNYVNYSILDLIIGCNYAYIKEFNRYYFITNITSIRNDLWQIDMKVDVLMSYKDQIKKLDAFIDRNEFNYNLDLEDLELPTQSDVNVSITSIPNDLFGTDDADGRYYVLTLVSDIEVI